MIEKLGIILIYVYLTLVNIWGFSKLDIKHEANFHIRFLFRKIGKIPTQILTILFLSLLVFIMPLSSFFEGIIFGLFFFNVVHDYYTIQQILRKKKDEQKTTV